MPAVVTSFRVLTWCCIVPVAVLSLLPAQSMMRTGVPGGIEHFVAYTESTAIAAAAYWVSRGITRIIGFFWIYVGVLEYLQHFSPGHPSIADFVASALGALGRLNHRCSFASLLEGRDIRIPPDSIAASSPLQV